MYLVSVVTNQTTWHEQMLEWLHVLSDERESDMNFDERSQLPLFQQVAAQIEAAILSGAFEEMSQIPSTTEVSKQFQINPATVLKGMNLLVDKQIIEKKRGIGMFVKTGARAILQEEKRDHFLNQEITQLITQAKQLDISLAALIKQIESGYER